MTALPVPTIPLDTGVSIPQLGFGVFLVEPGETERIVGDALEVGYRHIDTASYYKNEAEVGRALANSGIARDEIFVTTKLWNSDQPRAAAAFEESLDRLGVDEVDLYLIHWPQPERGEALDAWRSLIDIAGTGRARAIGVSNFEIEHLQQLIDETGVRPAVNQVELHPLHQRRDLVRFCVDNEIAVEAWGPLGQGKSDIFERPQVLAAASEHDKTPAQVVLRWHVQHGRIVFPKTSHRERMIENANIFDFELTEAQLRAIDELDEGRRFGPDPRTFNAR